MVWFIIVRNIESNRLELVGPESDCDLEDPRYDRVAHIIPFKEEPDPQRLNFGVHNLGRDCACHPKITEVYSQDRTIITHKAAVN
jgi:hypothetical protein